jgi:maltose alpha-D-glucosyltransferase/alpha-amylase
VDQVSMALIEKCLMRMPASAATQARWFRHKLSGASSCRLLDLSEPLPGSGDPPAALAIVRFDGAGNYLIPVTLGSRNSETAGRVLTDCGTFSGDANSGDSDTVLIDAASDGAYVSAVLALMESNIDVQARNGVFEFRRIGAYRGWSVETISNDYTNSVVIAHRSSALKTFRVLTAGINPDVEIGTALTQHTQFGEIARVLGEGAYVRSDGARYSVAVQTEAIPNVGDVWTVMGAALDSLQRDGSPTIGWQPILPGCSDTCSADAIGRLGATIGRLHLALASIDLPGFARTPVSPAILRGWKVRLADRAAGAVDRLDDALRRPGFLGGDALRLARLVIEAWPSLESSRAWGAWECDAADAPNSGRGELIRCHGDLHLGQVLLRPDGRFAVIDFEGEPLAPLSERRALASPARDVAGMLRSFSYAAHSARLRAASSGLHEYDLLLDWEHLARRWFLQGYFGEVDGAGGGLWPASQEARQWLISLFEIEKAFYEVDYEINNRPDWAVIPLSGILQVLERWGGGRA